MDKLVTVVVPIYNVEKYLDRCIQSIVDQTYKNIEIILVDDGSPDNCPAMCDNWAQKDVRIKVIHKKNEGLGMARNTGIENAAGEYIFFFDSDDYVDATVVEKCVCNAVNNNSDVVVFGNYIAHENGEIVQEKIQSPTLKFEDNAVRNDLLPYMFTYEMNFGVSAWGKMYSLNTIKHYDIKFKSEREIISEDAYFALELFSKVSIVTIVPEDLYYYCIRNNSLSRKYNKERQAQNDVFLKKSMEYVKQSELPDKILAHIQSRYHGFTLGTMMQIVKSELSKEEKKKELKKIYNNQLLRETLKNDVIKLDGRLPRVFWRVLKIRCYPLCSILLRCNAQN